MVKKNTVLTEEQDNIKEDESPTTNKHMFPFILGPPPGPKLPIRRKSFQKIRHFVLLMILSKNPEGISAYQIEKYKIPRGSLLRDIDNFEKNRCIEIKEQIIEGRVNKLLFLSKLGLKHLKKLQTDISRTFALMTEIAPLETKAYGKKFMKEMLKATIVEKIKSLHSKKESLEYFEQINIWAGTAIQRLEGKTNKFRNLKRKINDLINIIENEEELNREQIEKFVKDSL